MRTRAPLLLLFALFACGKAERPKDQWPIATSELLANTSAADPREATYRRYCIGCHGADGKGNGGFTGADFTKAESPLLARSDAELLASVRDGKRGVSATMPAHSPVLSEAQIAAVISFVRERFSPSAPAPMGSPNDETLSPAPVTPAPVTPAPDTSKPAAP